MCVCGVCVCMCVCMCVYVCVYVCVCVCLCFFGGEGGGFCTPHTRNESNNAVRTACWKNKRQL